MRGRTHSRYIAALAVAGLALASLQAWPANENGRRLFEARCIACHELPDAAEAETNGLLEHFDKMAELARLKPDEEQSVLDFILSHTQESVTAAALEEDRALFEEKCDHCHSLQRIFLEPLTDESLQHVVARMQARSGIDWLSDSDVQRILDYLAKAELEAPEPEPLGPDANGHEIFEARCMACHTLERVFTKPVNGDAETEWAHVISRMRGRAPQWMTDEEAQKIFDYLLSLPPPAGEH